jgi:hypothetical protein
LIKKPTNWKLFGKRPEGRPKNRWIDGILKDMQVLKVKNWKKLIGNRNEWNNLVEKAKTHPELERCRRRRRNHTETFSSYRAVNTSRSGNENQLLNTV